MKLKHSGIYSTLGLGIIIFIITSLVSVVIFRGLKENNSLVSRNAGERAINDYFSILRETDSQAEASLRLVEQTGMHILGMGEYDKDGTLLFRQGTAPAALPVSWIPGAEGAPRQYVHSRENRSLIIIQRPPPRPDRRKSSPVHEEIPDVPRGYLYWEISQPAYWNRDILLNVSFVAAEVAAALVIFLIAFLIGKNSEYRRRIEEQKNLVVIGTAASTLAHEIKNPLSIIRLQTELIARIAGKVVDRELGIINDETKRLTLLAGQVNDFLRDPAGNPVKLNPLEILPELGAGILGMPLRLYSDLDSPAIWFDRNRFRSVVENILLNAAESGSHYGEIEVKLYRKSQNLMLAFYDRGSGIKPGDMERVRDPFFTTKSSGTGVGLGVVDRFISAAGGFLYIENREDGGACVSLEIPEYRE